MKKQLSAVLFILLFFMMLASAGAISVMPNSPVDKAIITQYSQSFIFSFDEEPTEILNCSIIANNEVVGYRNSLIMRTNNKISLELEAGEYAWYIRCLDKSLNEITSATKSLTVDLGAEIKEGYQTFYNSDGSRTYALTIAPGQKTVTLPAMKGGESIEIKLGGKIYILDVVKMGAHLDTTFVDVRDRSTGKTHKMLTPSVIELDFNNDNTIDLELALKNVERGVDAYFALTPYPTAAQPEDEPEETPGQPPETETPPAIPSEQPVQEQPSEGASGEEPGDALEPGETSTGTETGIIPDEPKQAKSSWLIPTLIIIAVLVILLIILSGLKGKKSRKQNPLKEDKKAAKKEMQETEQQLPNQQEKFDIIKSNGRRK